VVSIGEVAYRGDSLVHVLLNYDQAKIVDYEEGMASLLGVGSHTLFHTKLDLDLSSSKAPPAKPSIIDPQKLEIKPPHLKYVVLGANNTLLGIISNDHKKCQVE